MLKKLFRPRAGRAVGARLYGVAVDQARRPEFYTELGVADAIDARFELYNLHVTLLVLRLKGAGEEATEAGQGLFDEFVGALDHSLRELGVGDLSVAKKMRKLGEALYGRAKAYAEALEPEPDRAAVEGLIARTVFGDEAAQGSAAPLADYVLRAHAALAAQPVEEILQGRPAWPSVRS